jgi:hypothetical protein
MHKGRAVCRAVGGIIFGRPAAMVGPINRVRVARAFLTARGIRDHATSEIDKILKRKIDSSARTRGMLFLAA